MDELNASELVDVYDEAGVPTGTADRRSVHKDGRWHRCVHCVVVQERGRRRRLILQRRGLALDEYPGLIDVTVAGHLRAGEAVAAATRREFNEELGVDVAFSALAALGEYSLVVDAGGIFAREQTDVLLLVDPRPLADYAFNPIEVDALVALDLDDVCRFWQGQSSSVRATERTRDGRSMRRVLVATEFVNEVPDYWPWLADRLRARFGHADRA